MVQSTNHSLISFIDSEDSKKYDKKDSWNFKIFAPAASLCAFGA